MSKYLRTFIIALSLFIYCLSPMLPASAQSLMNTEASNKITNNLQSTAQGQYDTSATLEVKISNIIKAVLSVLGVIFITLMFLTGNDWMQAAGNEEKVKKARDRIQSLIIGLIIILLAYALSSGFSSLLATALLK